MVVFDTSTILLSIDPLAKPPLDPATGLPVAKCKERIEHLLKTLQASNTTILIPTPVLAEYLVGAGPNKGEYVDKIVTSKNFEPAPFNIKAAIELSLLADPDLDSAKKLDEKTTWAKLKYDRQIIAIAKAAGANRVYTDDNNLAACARNNGIAATLTWEIPLPPEAPQLALGLEPPENGQ
jgi:predicted nucleic acid-binding protein